MSYKALQAIMGHSDINITMNTYVSANEDFKAEQMKKVEENLKSANLM